jgi:hypothetical protein
MEWWRLSGELFYTDSLLCRFSGSLKSAAHARSLIRWILSWVIRIHFTFNSLRLILVLFFHICLSVPDILCRQVSALYATCHALIIILDSITLIILGYKYKLWHISCNVWCVHNKKLWKYALALQCLSVYLSVCLRGTVQTPLN